MKKILSILMIILTVLVVPGVILANPGDVLAQNLEMLDEMTMGLELSSDDIILNSDHVEIGARIGAFDFKNSDTIKNSAYALGTVKIKGFSIFDWRTER